jgi:energy-coupling factor transporter ATP-binding protein EcfA2
MNASITVQSPVTRTPRVLQLEGMFDLQPTQKTALSWEVRLPLDEKSWNVGLIVGPSGCGKSTIARTLWPTETARGASFTWPADRALVDAFPAALSIKDIAELLSSVGFSAPPAWLRPYAVLSTGQQFRVTLARLLAEAPSLAVLDEYSSVVDRIVAQVGSAALARTVRRRNQRFIAVTCHHDVEEWLQPDWVFQPEMNTFTWRLLQRRPAIELQIFRCKAAAWALFQHHHYLNHALANGAVCFLATWRGRPVAFSAWVNAMTRRGGRREHRTVTLPDFQGVGIGFAVSTFLASLWKGLGFRASSTTTHPAFIAARKRSPLWRLSRAPSLGGAARERRSRLRHAATRLTAGFEYIGPPMSPALGRRLLGYP